jgi:hemoglobin-like flavoprotein
MTPEQLELVRATLVEVEEDPDAFGARFYERLFASDPDARALFPERMADQRRKLVEELALLAGMVSDMPAFVERAREMGARHCRHGVRSSHYVVMERALLLAFADLLGPRWDRATLLAWQRLYRLMAETMLEGSAGTVFGAPTD